MTADLPAALWIDAQLRRFTAEGKNHYILQKGAYAAGTILLKINTLDGSCRLQQQQRDLNGKLGWMILLKGEKVPEREADDLIARAGKRDPDLWIIEIEDKSGENPFEGEIF